MEIQFDQNKSNLSLILNFNGVMELGYAVFLYDNNGTTSLWNPPKEGTNLDSGTTIILSASSTPSLSFYNGKSLDLSFAFSGIDDKLKDYLISAVFYQDGIAIGNPFILKGELSGQDQEGFLFITMRS
jgi:hypothetical protein